ncbi:MAG: photosynthetic reaction center cytochrome PufC [Pseudomonadota bacterium]
MLPKWFNDWNSDNPTDIYGPAILVGAMGGAVLVAAMLVAFGQPFATVSIQTGPRGTGMSVTEFKSTAARPDPTIAGYVTSEPIPPQPGDPLAVDVFENVPPALEQVTAANYERLVAAMRSWTGIPDLLDDPENYQTQVAYQMIEMTQNINENWVDHVAANAEEVGVVCYTCHRGEAVPSDIWFRVTPVNDVMAGWSANQNKVTPLSQSTSLPSDALTAYLLDYEVIGVHDLESRVAGSPAGGELPSIQDAERTYSFMNYIDNSLGVNCVYCHNSRAFYDAEQVTPQWITATLGIAMSQELNNDYLLELEELYPEDRLGPLHGDAPKAACKTCHKGYQQPMQGLNVIGNWPELATTGAPVYE